MHAWSLKFTIIHYKSIKLLKNVDEINYLYLNKYIDSDHLCFIHMGDQVWAFCISDTQGKLTI